MIELEKQGEVMILRMNAGENRFGPDAIRLWHECLDEAEAMEGPKALVTTGSGKFYSNGLDLDHMGSDRSSRGRMSRAFWPSWSGFSCFRPLPWRR